MRKSILFTTILFILLLSSVSAQDKRALKLLNNSQEYYSDGKYEKALEEINKALEIQPDFGSAYQVRGNIYFSMKEYQYALMDYHWGIYFNKNYSGNYYNRGNTYYALKYYDSALADANQAIKLQNDHAPSYILRGNTYSFFKEYTKAIEDYTTAINLEPNSMASYYNRGLAAKFAGLYERAYDDLSKAVELDGKKFYSNYILAIIEPLAHMGKFEEIVDVMIYFRKEYKSGFIDNKNKVYFKKYVEAITNHLAQSDFNGTLRVLEEAELAYSESSSVASVTEYDRLVYSSILTLKGLVFEKLNKEQLAKQAYEQSLVINNYQPEVKQALNNLQSKAALVVQQDHEDPTIKIIEPVQNTRAIGVDDDVAANTSQRIRGQAIDPSGIKSVRLNNKLLKVEENGYFDTVVNLTTGVNVFNIVATDKAANTVAESIQINTVKEKVMGASLAAVPVKLNYDPVYHAILIAETEYSDRNIPSLKGPVKDMRKIFNVLSNQYNFALENTDTLVNASKTTILETIINKANSLGENDNLVIFYAGHGELIKQPDNTEEGFLVPVDALKGRLSSYISSDDLMRTIKYSKSKHILFVADACFAGSLFRDMEKDAPTPVVDAYKDKSRKLLASGNRTAVPDESEFIEYLRLALQENKEKYITAEQLIDTFKTQYKTTTRLSLQYFPIKNVEDFGGQFVFKRK